MRSSLECIPCFIRQALEAARQVCDDEKIVAGAMRDVLQLTAKFDLDLSPPHMGQVIHRVLREALGNADPYRKIKRSSTELALGMLEIVRKHIKQSDNAFETAVRFSIAGNILDFAQAASWSEQHIQASFNKALEQPINQALVAELQDELLNAKTVLVLNDNAGETVFDRLLIEQMAGHLNVVCAVKGSPVINDAIIEDAKEAGLDQVAELITNGTDAPGTILDQCSEDFLKYFNEADVVLAKGQANFETLNTVSRKVHFLTQIKCALIAGHYGYQLGDWVVTNTEELRKKDMMQANKRNCVVEGMVV